MFEAFTYFCGALFILTATIIRIMAQLGRFSDRVRWTPNNPRRT